MSFFAQAFWLGIGTFVVLAAIAFFITSRQAGARAKMSAALTGRADFLSHDILATGNRAIGLDEERHLMGVALRDGRETETALFPFRCITGVDVEVDGDTITHLGLFSAVSESIVRNIDLVITTNHPDLPVLRIPMHRFSGAKLDSASRQLQSNAIGLTNAWAARFRSIVRANGEPSHGG